MNHKPDVRAFLSHFDNFSELAWNFDIDEKNLETIADINFPGWRKYA